MKEKIEKFLEEEFGYTGKYVEPKQMNHGSCCCCRVCGQYHDECVCSNNRIYKFLQELFNEI